MGSVACKLANINSCSAAFGERGGQVRTDVQFHVAIRVFLTARGGGGIKLAISCRYPLYPPRANATTSLFYPPAWLVSW